MNERAKFKYSAQDGVLELEGSEEFVSKHFEGLTDILRMMARHTVIEQKKEAVAETDDETAPPEVPLAQQEQTESIANYPKTFSEINGKLKIVTQIPGSSTKSQMTNAALLYAYGSELMGEPQVSYKEIREVCEEHGCLDGPNFAKIFDDKTIFLSDGVKGGKKQAKLTFQGHQKAKGLLANE
ncbi:MAG: hypothetical protein ABSH06_25370 [Thermodesulfobacteriota bacterium]|jgi:hypothetical protein